MSVLQLLHEIADVSPVEGSKHAAVASAAGKIGVDITTAYRWAREGMGAAKLEHVLRLADAVAERRGQPVTVADLRDLLTAGE